MKFFHPLCFALIAAAGPFTVGVGAAPPTTEPTSGSVPRTADPALLPPAATSSNVTNDDRRKYLLALWADRQERSMPRPAPPSRPRTGTSVQIPAFQDGSPSGATLVSVDGACTLLHALIQVAESGNVRIGTKAAGLFHRTGRAGHLGQFQQKAPLGGDLRDMLGRGIGRHLGGAGCRGRHKADDARGNRTHRARSAKPRAHDGRLVDQRAVSLRSSASGALGQLGEWHW